MNTDQPAPSDRAVSAPAGASRQPLAIVGVSALFPGSSDADGFWRDILAGRDLTGPVPEDYWLLSDYHDADPKARDKTYGSRGAFLDAIDFDALSWGMPPNLLEATDTAQLLALVVAQRVLEDATRGDFSHLDRERTSIVLGVTSAQELLGDMVSRLQRPVWVKALREAGLPESEVVDACDRIASHYVEWQEASFPGLLGNVIAGRIANRLDLHGTNCVTDAACASTFSALSMAANELWLGEADLVIAGGVDTMNGIFMHMCFSKTPALSPTGDCRPFSDSADGTLLGEGMAMFAVRRLEDAERDGDPIYAVIRAVGTSSDGRSKSVYAPVSEGQARAIERAYARAGFGADTVELIEAHGTGTKAGDAAEFGGLRLAFDAAGRADRQWCALGSVKSQIGHTKAAAGSAGLFKAVMAVHQRTLPPTIKVDRPNPKLDIEASPFFLNDRARPWVRGADHPRRAGVSSFGFGGSNFHVAVEEYTGPSRALRRRAWPAELLRLAADTPAALAEAADALASRVDAPGSFAFEAWRSATEERFGAARLAVVAADGEAAARALRDAAQRVRSTPQAAFVLPNGAAYGVGDHGDKVAWLFPGQGSQYVDMGSAIARAWPQALAVWDRARDLALGLDTPLDRLVFALPAYDDATRAAQAEALTATAHAQPAIGAVSAGLVAVLGALGLSPDLVAGHSFGELAALHAAGALSRDDLLVAATQRGRAMAEAATVSGAMTAVRGPLGAVEAVLREASIDVALANHNHPTQVVLSGATEAVQAAEAACEAAGLPCRRLEVGTAFHSPVVAGAASAFSEALADVEFGAADVPVLCASTAAPWTSDADALRAGLGDAIAAPVRWVDVVEALYADGVRTFVEVGPGHVLSGLVERTLGDRPHRAIPLDRKGKDGVVQLLTALGQLYAAGVDASWSALWDGWREPVDPDTVSKPKLAVPVKGSNLGRPYPPPGGSAALPPPNPPRPEPVPQVVERVVEKIVEVPVAADTPRAPQAAPPSSPPAAEGWLAAFQEIQRQTAEAHAAFQDAMARSHEAYLATVGQAFAGLTGQPVSPPVAAPAPRVAPPSYAPPAPVVAAPAPVAPAPVAVPAAAAAPVAAPAPVAPAPAAAPAVVLSPSGDVGALLLSVVADKTGYPAEMLSAEMDLEADLGVDSIKRVEILSAIYEVSGIPEVDASTLAPLRTLGEIAAALGAPVGASALGAPVGGTAAAPAPAPTAPSAPASGDVGALLLQVVADKTGYPAEMLSAEMDLEADLGVDSIKRVEILSAIYEVSGIPEVDASTLAPLRTLGEIATALGAPVGASALGAPVEGPGTPGQGENPVTSRLSRAPVGAAEAAGLGRFAVRVVPAPAAGLGVAGLSAGVGVIGRGPRAKAVVAACAAVGIAAHASSSIDGSAAVWVVAPDASEGVEPWFVACFEAARAEAPPAALVLVQSGDGRFGATAAAWSAGVPGLAKTAAAELGHTTVRAVEIDTALSHEAAARAIVAELRGGGLEVEVGLAADGSRWTRHAPPVSPSEGALALSAEDVVLATGGARGVTAATMVALARASRATFLLLGRTPLADDPAEAAGVTDESGLKRALMQAAIARGEKPSPAVIGRQVRAIVGAREVRDTLAAIAAAGGRAAYLVADVADRDALAAALDAAQREVGTITALVHGAGVLADRSLADKTLDDVRTVLGPKVDGLRAVLDVIDGDALRALLLFGSVAGWAGNPGQADYAFANEVLARVGAWFAASHPACLVRTLGWGPWDGGMVTPQLRRHFDQLGVPLIPLDVGAAMLVDELRGGDDTAVVLGGDPSKGLGQGAVRPVHARVPVDRAYWPMLDDHRVDGDVVVPVALALAWMARAAAAVRPDLHLVGASSVEVVRGLVIPDFDDGLAWLDVRARQLDNGDGARVLAETVDADGRVRHRATFELAEAPAVPWSARTPGPEVQAWGDAVVYDGATVFHGPGFRVIDRVDGAAESGLVASLHGAAAHPGWDAVSLLVDAAALDGVLQLGLLWVEGVLDGASLPTGIEAMQLGGSGVLGAGLVARLRRRDVRRDRAVYDAEVLDAQGQVVLSLRGVAHHRLPGRVGARPPFSARA